MILSEFFYDLAFLQEQMVHVEEDLMMCKYFDTVCLNIQKYLNIHIFVNGMKEVHGCDVTEKY